MNNKLKMIALSSALLAVIGCKKKDEAAETPPAKEAKVAAATAEDKAVKEQPVATTESVVGHHLEAFGAGNIEDILSDYSDDAFIMTPMGVVKGKAALKPLFEGMVKEFKQPNSKLNLGKQSFNGELGYITWTGDTADNTYELATDTFVVVGGKIVAQSFAAKITPKKAPEAKEAPAKDEPIAESPAKAAVDRHLAAFGGRNMENILADYTAESVIMTPQGELIGGDAMKPVFEAFFAEFAKDKVKFQMGKLLVEGDMVLFTWSAETPDNTYEWATDTLVVRDEKIVFQTFTPMVTPKS